MAVEMQLNTENQKIYILYFNDSTVATLALARKWFSLNVYHMHKFMIYWFFATSALHPEAECQLIFLYFLFQLAAGRSCDNGLLWLLLFLQSRQRLLSQNVNSHRPICWLCTFKVLNIPWKIDFFFQFYDSSCVTWESDIKP